MWFTLLHLQVPQRLLSRNGPYGLLRNPLGIVRSKKIGCTLETAGSLENFNLSRKLQSNALGSEIVCFLLLLVLMCVFYWF